MHADLLSRPALTNPADIVAALGRLRGPAPGHAGSAGELWQALTQAFTVDLDAAAAVLPRIEDEPHWLPQRR
jgi:hypothetical protein